MLLSTGSTCALRDPVVSYTACSMDLREKSEKLQTAFLLDGLTPGLSRSTFDLAIQIG
jgi:hypothetical protein